MSNITVRPPRSEEADTLAAFLIAMAHESEGMALNPETVLNGVRRVLNHPELGHYRVLEVDGRLAGMCLVTSEWSDWHNRPYWWFQSVYIQPGLRGQGLLRCLMQAVEDEAHAAGVQELRLYVESNNDRAIGAYRKQGWHEGHYRLMQKSVSAMASS